MEIKESHKTLREVYTISNNLDISFSEVKALTKGEREYLYNIVRSALESKRSPQMVMSACYHTTKATLFITEKGTGSDVTHKGKFDIKNVLNKIEVEAIFDTLSFNPDKYDTHALNLNYNLNNIIYIKYNEKMDKISFNDMVFLNIFDKMYEVKRNDVINAFELGGKYNMVKITKCNEA